MKTNGNTVIGVIVTVLGLFLFQTVRIHLLQEELATTNNAVSELTKKSAEVEKKFVQVKAELHDKTLQYDNAVKGYQQVVNDLNTCKSEKQKIVYKQLPPTVVYKKELPRKEEGFFEKVFSWFS
jgi:hypothetical protein